MSALTVKGRDLLQRFTTYLIELEAQQAASAARTQVATSANSALIIARELTRLQCTVEKPIEQCMFTCRQAQQKVGDTLELALVMETFLPVWNEYRADLQAHARDYFKQHTIEDEQFLRLYFNRISCLTLWNDVWMNHVGAANGGRKFKLLDEVRTLLLMQMAKGSMNTADAKRVNQAELLLQPENVLPFTPTELHKVAELTKTAMDAQITLQDQGTQELKDHYLLLEQALHFLSRVRSAYNTNKLLYCDYSARDPNQFDDCITHPAASIHASVCNFFESLINRPHTIEPGKLDLTEQACQRVRDRFDAEFQVAFADVQWREAYQTYVLANKAVCDTKLVLQHLRIIQLIHAPDTTGDQMTRDEVTQIRQAVLELGVNLTEMATELDRHGASDALLLKLEDERSTALAILNRAQENVLRIAMMRDTNQYILTHVMHACIDAKNQRQSLEEITALIKQQLTDFKAMDVRSGRPASLNKLEAELRNKNRYSTLKCTVQVFAAKLEMSSAAGVAHAVINIAVPSSHQIQLAAILPLCKKSSQKIADVFTATDRGVDQTRQARYRAMAKTVHTHPGRPDLTDPVLARPVSARFLADLRTKLGVEFRLLKSRNSEFAAVMGSDSEKLPCWQDLVDFMKPTANTFADCIWAILQMAWAFHVLQLTQLASTSPLPAPVVPSDMQVKLEDQ